MSKHTKGPWHKGAGNGEGCIFMDGEGRMRLETGGTTLYPIAKVIHGWNEEEDEANATLMAASPELLAALQRCVPWIGHMIAHGGHLQSVAPNDAIGALQQAEAAIAKALEE